jgi:two-component sensor histidine kinase
LKEYARYENLPMETADGRHVDVEFVSNIYNEEEGKKVIQCNIRNITERKLLDDKLKSSLKEKNLLLHELNHRVNNNLQLMVNLASLQRKNITDEKTAALFDETQSRIKSIALVHEKLYLSKGFYDINFSDYLKDLANSVFNSFVPAGHKLSLKMDVEDIRLEIEPSVTCGLIINELLSNVFKYAFPGNRNGEVFVSFHRVGHGHIELIVRDNGIGIPSDVDLRTTKSLGMKLIYNLVEKQLDGTITIDRSSGTLFKIIFKEVLMNNLNGRL